MKYQTLFVVLAVVGSCKAKEWLANQNAPRKYQGKTVDELRAVFNLQHLPRDQYFHRPSLMNTQNDTLPSSFSWRVNASECLTPRVDQGECGSCYAHATASMLAERLCIHERDTGKHKVQVEPLAPNYIMSCDPYAYGCNGGMIS